MTTIRLGTEQVEVPTLSALVGPERLRPANLSMNAAADIALVDRYLAALADLAPRAPSAATQEVISGTRLLAAAAAVQNWRNDRTGAVSAFQRVEHIAYANAADDGVVAPGSATWRALFTYGELALRLEGLRDRPRNPADYIHTGGFKEREFVEQATSRFRADTVVGPRFNTTSVPGMLDLLRRISRDARVIDVRWIAYMLATAMWKTAIRVDVPATPPATRPRRVM